METLDAINFLKDHAEWLKNNYKLNPEGREYSEKFMIAVKTIICNPNLNQDLEIIRERCLSGKTR